MRENAPINKQQTRLVTYHSLRGIGELILQGNHQHGGKVTPAGGEVRGKERREEMGTG